LEVGNSETVRHLAGIRDNILGHLTQVNVFVAVSYNRNAARNSDSWWACVAVRDTNPPNPPPNPPPTWPPCDIIGEVARTPGGRYQRVEVPLQGNTIWSIPTHLLFHPEPIPVVQPPLPATFEVDVERLRKLIVETRPP
jgi:hypothetical protein